MLAGHAALASQTGASFAYHKAVDVVLWQRGPKPSALQRAVLAEVRDRFDAELRERWAEQFGPPTPEQAEQLTWQKLNYGQDRGSMALRPRRY